MKTKFDLRSVSILASVALLISFSSSPASAMGRGAPKKGEFDYGIWGGDWKVSPTCIQNDVAVPVDQVFFDRSEIRDLPSDAPMVVRVAHRHTVETPENALLITPLKSDYGFIELINEAERDVRQNHFPWGNPFELPTHYRSAAYTTERGVFSFEESTRFLRATKRLQNEFRQTDPNHIRFLHQEFAGTRSTLALACELERM